MGVLHYALCTMDYVLYTAGERNALPFVRRPAAQLECRVETSGIRLFAGGLLPMTPAWPIVLYGSRGSSQGAPPEGVAVKPV